MSGSSDTQQILDDAINAAANTTPEEALRRLKEAIENVDLVFQCSAPSEERDELESKLLDARDIIIEIHEDKIHAGTEVYKMCIVKLEEAAQQAETAKQDIDDVAKKTEAVATALKAIGKVLDVLAKIVL
ncbi:hypothetical protein [Maridesulfovibrio sp.]|uniref:hypothetical protein n=1 Tax=unclassified Maridesulfovibrio TaxID=2794999 RepID=UPI003B003A2D